MQPTTRTTRAAWGVCAASLALVAVALLLCALGWSTPPPSGFVSWPGQAIWAVGAAGAPILGGAIASRRPGNPYGWVWVAYGAATAVALAGRAYASYATVHEGLPLRGPAGLVGDLGWIVWLSLIPFLLLLFPTGSLPSRRWRWVARVGALGGGLMVLAGTFAPRLGTVPIDNPIGAPGPLGAVLTGLADTGVYLVFAAIVASAASLVPRYLAAQETERHQIGWFGYAAAIVGLFFALDPFLEQLPGTWDSLAETASMSILYVAIGIAILRHGLYDIDRLVNRTLVYATLTGLLLGTYVLTVGYLGSVFRVEENPLVSLAATGLVAVLFAPLRERLQQAVNRLMYGRRVDPYLVVSQLGRRLEAAAAPDDVLATIVQTIAHALDLARVEIWFVEGERLRLGAVHGEPPDTPYAADVASLHGERGIALVLPLAHRGQDVGAFCVAPRPGHTDVPPGDRSLLRDLAAQVGPAVHAVALTTELRSSLVDLRRSRQRLVATQEEERLRIHRDLHDGLGPVLASMRLRLEACLEAVQGTPALTADLEQLHELVGQATADIRTLVHDLHPPALAQLGLVGALAHHCDRFARETGIAVRFQSPDTVRLSATAQVALLRIVQEALVNVHKHARATSAEVCLDQCPAELRLSIRDDGDGLGESRHGDGAGISSMQARAELLGGTLLLRGEPHAGTLVTVQVPRGEEEQP